VGEIGGFCCEKSKTGSTVWKTGLGGNISALFIGASDIRFRGRSTCPSLDLDLDLDLFLGRDGIVKLLAESLGETKRGGWSTFIVGWDYMIASGRTGTTSNAH